VDVQQAVEKAAATDANTVAIDFKIPAPRFFFLLTYNTISASTSCRSIFTHNLATAYQVSDSILVLYRAHLAEAGAVERVVSAPQHPYTQLLISAIPRAHVARDWLAQDDDARRNGLAGTTEGCRFAERCPHAIPLC